MIGRRGVVGAIEKVAMKAAREADRLATARMRSREIPEDYVHRGWHVTAPNWRNPSWPDKDPVIDLDAGEGFGFHYGTMKAAIDRAPVMMDRFGGIKPEDLRFIDVWAPRDMPVVRVNDDMGMWDQARAWQRWLTEDGYVDLEPEKRLAIAEQIARERGHSIAPTPKGTVRRAFLDHDIPAISYVNAAEDRGSRSYAALDATPLRWGSRAKFADMGKSDLLAALPPVGALAILAAARKNKETA